MKLSKILLIIITLYFILSIDSKTDNLKENFDYYKIYNGLNKLRSKYAYSSMQSHMPKNNNLSEISYGYPYKYSPINCNNTIEHYQINQRKTCVPIAKITLYTMSGCPHCTNMKPEWEKFVKRIKSNCKYNKLIQVEHKKDDQVKDDIMYVPTIKLELEEDKLNNIPSKTIEFNYEMKAENFERFVIENISKDFLQDDGHFYTDCKKGKMYGKYYTICDDGHKKWNSY